MKQREAANGGIPRKSFSIVVCLPSTVTPQRLLPIDSDVIVLLLARLALAYLSCPSPISPNILVSPRLQVGANCMF